MYLFTTIISLLVIIWSAINAGAQLPTLDDEKAAYASRGFTWSATIEPKYPSAGTFTVTAPDIHGDTEGDDAWTSLHQYHRTGQQGYLERALAWGRYFTERYTQCLGSPTGGGYDTLCYDKGFLYDHIFGSGLLALYQYTQQSHYLDTAEKLGGLLEQFYNEHPNYKPGYDYSYYAVRWGARHLALMVQLAEAVPIARWINLRNRIIALWKAAPDRGGHGVYGLGYPRDYPILNSYPDLILVSPLMLAVLNNAFAEAYQVTNDPWFRTQMLRQAQFVYAYGLDQTYQYTGSRFGMFRNTGKAYHNYATANPVTFWDPVYTGQVVNILVRGYQYSGETAFLDRAWVHFHRANGGIYGQPVKRSVPNNVIHHFIDTKFSTASGGLYYDYGKGELQYMWTLFQNQGNPPAMLGGLPTQVPMVTSTIE